MKKFLSAMLAFTLVLCVCLPALALPTPIVVLADVEMRRGDYLHVGATSVSSAAPTDGTGYAHVSADGKTLTLHDFDNQDKTYAYNYYYQTALLINEEISLKLEGANKLTATEADNEGITVYGNLTIDESSTGSLEITADNGIFFGSNPLTINGGTVVMNCGEVCVMGSNFTMNGGELIASSGSFTLCCPDFTMNGGHLKAYSDDSYAIWVINFTMTDGHLEADGGEYYAILCDNFVMTGGMAEFTSDGNNAPLHSSRNLNCTVTKADNVVVSSGSYFRMDTAEALEKMENGNDPGKRTVVLGALKPEPVVPAAPAAVPTTGDNAMIALWAALAMFSAAGMIFISRRRAVK